jgi:hypothetical protein
MESLVNRKVHAGFGLAVEGEHQRETAGKPLIEQFLRERGWNSRHRRPVSPTSRTGWTSCG